MKLLPDSALEERNNTQTRSAFIAGVVAMLPLSIAVLPWGILAGSMAVEADLTFSESVAMSALAYAGAAQLVSLTMLKSGVGLTTILISVFFITLQHLLYGLTLRENVAGLKAKYRLSIGFLLTDELFALTGAKTKRQFSVSYALGAGLSFYLFWNLFSIIGIMLANAVPDLSRFHLDFSIVATFVAIVVPMIKRMSTLVGVLLSLALSMLLSYWQTPGAIIIAGVLGMLAAVIVATIRGER